jgi:hypothetical protein
VDTEVSARSWGDEAVLAVVFLMMVMRAITKMMADPLLLTRDLQ